VYSCQTSARLAKCCYRRVALWTIRASTRQQAIAIALLSFSCNSPDGVQAVNAAVSMRGPQPSRTSPVDAAAPDQRTPDAGAPADACPPGTNECPCFSNGTCNVVGGVALLCRNDRCVSPGGGPAGDLGQPCGTDAECAPYRGLTLACVSGLCAAPGCPTGQAGCPCIAGEDCLGDAVCASTGFCARPTCNPGERDCRCGVGPTCAAPLTCVAGTCRAEARLAFSIADPAARACQGRIEIGAGQVPRVEFESGLRGQTTRRGQSVGFAFITESDVPARAARMDLVFDGAARPGDVALTDSKCFDRLGQSLPGPGLAPAR
jgi:hypothetical protein